MEHDIYCPECGKRLHSADGWIPTHREPDSRDTCPASGTRVEECVA